MQITGLLPLFANIRNTSFQYSQDFLSIFARISVNNTPTVFYYWHKKLDHCHHFVKLPDGPGHHFFNSRNIRLWLRPPFFLLLESAGPTFFLQLGRTSKDKKFAGPPSFLNSVAPLIRRNLPGRRTIPAEKYHQ